jgi:glycerophosphoryl diester phosphodiesterase
MALYPENSIIGFDYAMSIGVDALEMDLNMTKDKNIIIYHDKKIDTELCTNGLSLPIKDLTLLEIKKYDCGVFQNKNFKKQDIQIQKIPTFIELLEWINNSNYSNKNTIKLNIEIKTNSDLDTDIEIIDFVNEVIGILNKYNIKNRTIIQSFDERALTAVKNIDENIKLSLLIEDPNINMIELAKKINVDIISPEYSLLNKDLVKQMHDNKFSVLPWGINSTNSLQKMIDINVDGIIADDPKKMIDYIKYKI